MIKNLFYLILLGTLSEPSFSQNQRMVWRMGYRQNPPTFTIDFNSGVPVIDTLTHPFALSMYVDDAGMCDRNGNLLFYTNGISISNANHDMMVNGDSLDWGNTSISWQNSGLPVNQGAIVIPDPLDTNQYYLFHMSYNSNTTISDTLLETKVDMRLDNGLGAVTYKNLPKYVSPFIPGQLTATKHANGRDWWLIAHGGSNDEFLIFLLSINGLSGPTIQHFGNTYNYTVSSCFSPDGQYYACTYDTGEAINVMNFDRCSGVLSNFRSSPVWPHAWSCCFSKNSKNLFVASRDYLLQFDITNTVLSYDTAAIWDGFTDPYPDNFVFMQLAPDNKIYITGFGSVQYLSVIKYPDSTGISCGVQQHSILLPGRNNGSMPNYPFYELGPVTGSVCDSLNGIKMHDKNSFVEVYPNPAHSLLKIYTDENSISSIRIYDALGVNLLQQKFISDLAIDISGFDNGVYFVELIGGETRLVTKFVKE
jgi:hypothetical protein